MGTWDQLASLPLEIDRYELEGRELAFSEEFVRYTTLITLRGGGEEGVGEDVVYDGLDHTLRQAGRSLAEHLGRELRPLTYVVSMRLGNFGDDTPETSERMLRVLERYPGTRFKLDPTNTWSDALIAELAASGAVDSLDLKGQYKGTPVDVDTDPELYRKLIEAFPDAWLEDPDINEETRPVLEPVRDRITWDAPIHSVAPNDVAPGGFNSPALTDGMPASPIHLKPAATGFRFG